MTKPRDCLAERAPRAGSSALSMPCDTTTAHRDLEPTDANGNRDREPKAASGIEISSRGLAVLRPPSSFDESPRAFCNGRNFHFRRLYSGAFRLPRLAAPLRSHFGRYLQDVPPRPAASPKASPKASLARGGLTQLVSRGELIPITGYLYASWPLPGGRPRPACIRWFGGGRHGEGLDAVLGDGSAPRSSRPRRRPGPARKSGDASPRWSAWALGPVTSGNNKHSNSNRAQCGQPYCPALNQQKKRAETGR